MLVLFVEVSWVSQMPARFSRGGAGRGGREALGSLWRSQQRPYYQRGSIWLERAEREAERQDVVLVVVAVIGANSFGGLAGRV